jgi:hypothetical protein
LVDGKPQQPADDLTGKTPPQSIQLNVTGARELTLVVEHGRFADVRGRVTWAEARLIR